MACKRGHTQHMSEVVQKWRDIERQIASRATLVAVSKTFTVAEILPILDAGQRVFGENRVQEAQSKWPDLKRLYPNVELHLLGPLQSNKVSDAVKLFDVIQTVDRPKIAITLAAEMKKQVRYLPCFLQVNIGREPQKAGVAPEEVSAFLNLTQQNLGLTILGLMCIPPAQSDPRPYFHDLAQMAKEHSLKHLSMGMSSDYLAAIDEGATYVRVGSALFGSRPQITT